MACKQTPTATLFGESVISSLGVSTLVQTDLQTVSIEVTSLITTTTCAPVVKPPSPVPLPGPLVLPVPNPPPPKPPVIPTINARQDAEASCVQTVITSKFVSQSTCCILPARSYPTQRLSEVTRRLRPVARFGGFTVAVFPSSDSVVLSYCCTSTDTDNDHMYPPTSTYSESSPFINHILTKC